MKVLLIELWGLGDATLMTTALRPLLAGEVAVTILCKPGTVDLLKPSYPAIEFIAFDAPWTAFRDKYRLASWPWKKIFHTLRVCRAGRFDAAASVRADPRDHLWMFLSGIARRMGFPCRGSELLLSHPLPAEPLEHRVDSWRRLTRTILRVLPESPSRKTTEAAALFNLSVPYLNAAAYPVSETKIKAPAIPKGKDAKRGLRVGLHCGARITVRRWKEAYFADLIGLLREESDFHLALFPDTDGYGKSLNSQADSCHENLRLPDLIADLAACDLLICNDSGPGHMAAAMGRPVLSFFGPAVAPWFSPYGENNHVVRRDLCPFHPCADHCHFPEPICLTELTPQLTWPEIRDWFQKQEARLASSLPI